MSVSNLIYPNSFDLYCRTMKSSGAIEADEINTTEYPTQSLGLYNNSNAPILSGGTGNPQITVTLKYNYTGVCTLFYDSVTSASQAFSGVSEVKLGTAGPNFNITGLPPLRRPDGQTVYTNAFMDHQIFVNSSGAPIPARLRLKQESATETTITLYPIGAATFPNATFSFLPFSFDYIVQN
jgi:hypothetical protein